MGNRCLSGHFASLVVSRKSASQRCFAAYRSTSFRSCFQKKGFCTPLFLFSPFPSFFFLFFLFYFFLLFYFSFLFLFIFLFMIIFQKKCLLPMGNFIFFKKVP